MPKVSVIVPNYNHSRYLSERIDSILNQSFQDFELILLDDCSTDNSREVINRYASDSHVANIVFNEKNSGNTFFQWDKGIKLAKGEYIWIAESDDVATPDFLARTVSALDRNRQASMCLTGSIFIDSDSNPIARPTWDEWTETDEERTYNGNKYICHNLSFRNNVYNASMVLFRHDAYDKIDKSFQKLKYAGDWQFWINMAIYGDVIEISKKMNRFRQHDNKVSNRATDGRGENDMIDVFHFLLFNKEIHLSNYLSVIIRGNIRKQLKRSSCDETTKQRLLERATASGVCSKNAYRMERINKILYYIAPCIKTSQNMKLK